MYDERKNPNDQVLTDFAANQEQQIMKAKEQDQKNFDQANEYFQNDLLKKEFWHRLNDLTAGSNLDIEKISKGNQIPKDLIQKFLVLRDTTSATIGDQRYRGNGQMVDLETLQEYANLYNNYYTEVNTNGNNRDEGGKNKLYLAGAEIHITEKQKILTSLKMFKKSHGELLQDNEIEQAINSILDTTNQEIKKLNNVKKSVAETNDGDESDVDPADLYRVLRSDHFITGLRGLNKEKKDKLIEALDNFGLKFNGEEYIETKGVYPSDLKPTAEAEVKAKQENK